MKILTYDIGGAYTKRLAADFDTMRVLSNDIFYFPFWKEKENFESFLKSTKEKADYIGVTMTAELSDVFSNKREGVEYIVSTCEKVLKSPVYLSVDKKLLKEDEIKNPLTLAAANWIGSVYYLEKKFGEGVLVDVGSTTTDIIPFRKNETLYKRTDLERLQAGQLIYTGILRTPVSAVVSRVPFRGAMTRISSEYFAITADVYNILDESYYSCETPDGRGKSRRASMRRIARVICADLDDLSKAEIREICSYIHEKQVEEIARAANEVAEGVSLCTAYTAGIGRKIASLACRRAGLKSVEVSENLPCLGLADMVRDYVRG